ncbi:MAG: hypothetical protein ABEH40_06715 [Haloferacaceae archaeon]
MSDDEGADGRDADADGDGGERTAAGDGDGGRRGSADAGATGADDSAGATDAGDAGSAPGTAPWMASGAAAAEETTLEDIAAEEEVPEGTPSIGYLPSLPEPFVSLGAGCLAAATLLSFGTFGFVIWMRVTGNVRDLMPWEVTLAAILMAVSTVFLAGGTYFARKRVRWTLTMLAALVGSFAILTIPFTVVAVVCIGLGRVHFTQPFVGGGPPDTDGTDGADGAGAEE